MCDSMINILGYYLKCIGCFSNDTETNASTSIGTNEIISENQSKQIKLINNYIDVQKLSYEQKFNLVGIKGNFFVKSVYDGDTITLQLPINLSVYNYISQDKINLKSINNPENKPSLYDIRIRLLGIDTPEMKPSKNLPNREEHIKKAINAKEFLSSLILNKIITVEFKENDKYGRPLGIIFINDTNINNLMIEKGHAKAYDGGTKDTNF